MNTNQENIPSRGLWQGRQIEKEQKRGSSSSPCALLFLCPFACFLFISLRNLNLEDCFIETLRIVCFITTRLVGILFKANFLNDFTFCKY